MLNLRTKYDCANCAGPTVDVFLSSLSAKVSPQVVRDEMVTMSRFLHRQRPVLNTRLGPGSLAGDEATRS